MKANSFAVLPFLLALPLSAQGATICVDATGIPPAGCTGTLFTDVGSAIGAASSGDTIKVYPGTYPPFLVLLSNITIEAAIPTNRPVIDASLPVPAPGIPTGGRGIMIDGGIVPGLTGITIDGFDVINGTTTNPGWSPPGSGAGLFLRSTDATIRNCSFTNCVATLDGGGIWIEGELAGVSPTLTGCDATGCIAVDGAGVCVIDSAPTFFQCDVDLCVAADEGGGYYFEGTDAAGASARLFSSVIEDNGAMNGGGIHIRYSATDIRASIIEDNSAMGTLPFGFGGGVCSRGGSPSFDTCVLVGNDAEEYGGGLYGDIFGDAIGAPAPPTITLKLCDVDSNVCTTGLGFGGGIFLAGNYGGFGGPGGIESGTSMQPAGSSETIFGVFDRTHIHDNVANDGGGAWLGFDVTASVDYCRVIANSASNNGGGFYLLATTGSEYFNSTFDNNSAGGLGGGLYSWFEDGNKDRWLNCLFVRNSGFDGGGMYLDTYDPLIQTSTFDSNSASRDGGAIYVATSLVNGPEINSCIMYANSSSAGASASKEIFFSGGASAVVHDSDWHLLPAGDPRCPTCIDALPQYVTGPGSTHQPVFDYYLDQSLSPCVNAGDPNLTPVLGSPPYVTATTDPLLSPDIGIADMGFHYNGAKVPPVLSKFTHDIPLGTSGLPEVSISAGGLFTFSLTTVATATTGVVASNAFIGGSASGTTPGIPFGSSVIPLLYDGYTQSLFGSPGLFLTGAPPSAVVNPAGGLATVQMFVPAGALSPTLIGTDIWHAFLVLDQVTAGYLVDRNPSNAVVFRLIP